MRVSIADAKNKLTQLVRAAEKGERITICRHGVPVVDLVVSKESAVEPRKFGTLKGRAEILDPNWDKAAKSPEELDLWLQGRF